MNIAGRLLSTSMVLSLTLLAGRAAGFLREIQLGAIFGVSRDTDLAIVMLTTPDLLVNLLLAGGLSAALIPEFARLDRGGRTRLFALASLMIFGLFGLIATVVVFFPRLLILVFAPGYAAIDPGQYSLQFAVAALAIPLAGLAGVTSALLNAEEKFFVVGSGTLVFNLTIVAMMLVAPWYPGGELLVLACAIALASVARYGSQLVAGSFYLSRQPSQVPAPDLGGLTRRFLQALGASTLVLLIPVILRAVVSLNGTGNIAAYNFATKLVELPLGIAITAISVVAFPALSKVILANDSAGMERLFENGVRRSLAIALAIAIPCLWFAQPLVALVFGHGRMTASDLVLIGDLARLGFLTLPLIAVSSMSTALLNARQQTGRLLKITLACLLVVPVAVIPGVVMGDARMTIIALPIFHLLLATALARAVRQPLFFSWKGLLSVAARPIILAGMTTIVCALLESLISPELGFLKSAFAVVAIGISVVMVAGLTKKPKVG